MRYEVMYILKPTVDEKTAFKSVADEILNNGGKILKTDMWGCKKFSCEVEGFTEGFYQLIIFEGSKCVDKLDKALKDSSDVLRHMFIGIGG